MCTIFFQLLTKFGFFSDRFFLKVPNTKFHGNPSSPSRAGSYGQTDKRRDNQTYGRTYMINVTEGNGL